MDLSCKLGWVSYLVTGISLATVTALLWSNPTSKQSVRLAWGFNILSIVAGASAVILLWPAVLTIGALFGLYAMLLPLLGIYAGSNTLKLLSTVVD